VVSGLHDNDMSPTELRSISSNQCQCVIAPIDLSLDASRRCAWVYDKAVQEEGWLLLNWSRHYDEYFDLFMGMDHRHRYLNNTNADNQNRMHFYCSRRHFGGKLQAASIFHIGDYLDNCKEIRQMLEASYERERNSAVCSKILDWADFGDYLCVVWDDVGTYSSY